MYSGDDSIPNCKPYEQSGVNATLPASGPSSIHQSMFNITRSDGHACNHLLGKRYIILNNDIPCSPIKHVNDNASPLKEQKLAMHVNTRHMAQYHPSPGVSHCQLGIPVPVQDPTNQLPELKSGAERKQSNSANSMQNAGMFTASEMDVSSQNATGNTYTLETMEVDVPSVNSSALGQNNSIIFFDTNISTLLNGNTVTYTSGQVSANNNASNKAKPISNTGQKKKKKPYDIFLPKASKKPSILPSKATLSTLYLNHKMGIAVSNSQTTAGHLDTRGVTQSKFLKSVLRWTNNLRYICDVRKQQLEFELFGDEPTFTADVPDLLKLLKDIDQQKNKVTYEEEHITGLIKAISRVLETCDNSTEEESIVLAGKILDNFLQRFKAMRFHGLQGSG